MVVVVDVDGATGATAVDVVGGQFVAASTEPTPAVDTTTTAIVTMTAPGALATLFSTTPATTASAASATTTVMDVPVAGNAGQLSTLDPVRSPPRTHGAPRPGEPRPRAVRHQSTGTGRATAGRIAPGALARDRLARRRERATVSLRRWVSARRARGGDRRNLAMTVLTVLRVLVAWTVGSFAACTAAGLLVRLGRADRPGDSLRLDRRTRRCHRHPAHAGSASRRDRRAPVRRCRRHVRTVEPGPSSLPLLLTSHELRREQSR